MGQHKDLPITCLHPEKPECAEPDDCACECTDCMNAWITNGRGRF